MHSRTRETCVCAFMLEGMDLSPCVNTVCDSMFRFTVLNACFSIRRNIWTGHSPGTANQKPRTEQELQLLHLKDDAMLAAAPGKTSQEEQVSSRFMMRRWHNQVN